MRRCSYREAKLCRSNSNQANSATDPSMTLLKIILHFSESQQQYGKKQTLKVVVHFNATRGTCALVARIPVPWVTIYLDTATTADKQLTSPLADAESNCILMALSSRRLYYAMITRHRFTTQGDNVFPPPLPSMMGNVVLSGGWR